MNAIHKMKNIAANTVHMIKWTAYFTFVGFILLIVATIIALCAVSAVKFYDGWPAIMLLSIAGGWHIITPIMDLITKD